MKNYIYSLWVLSLFSLDVSAGRLTGIAWGNVMPTQNASAESVLLEYRPELVLANRNNRNVNVVLTITAQIVDAPEGTELLTYRDQITLSRKSQTELSIIEIFSSSPMMPPITGTVGTGACQYRLWSFAKEIGIPMNELTDCIRIRFVIDMYWDDEVSTTNSNSEAYGVTRLNYPVLGILQNAITLYDGFTTDTVITSVITQPLMLQVVP